MSGGLGAGVLVVSGAGADSSAPGPRSFRRSSAVSPSSPNLSISHSPVAVRRNWTVESSNPSGLTSVAAARSPLMAVAWAVAPRCSSAHRCVVGLQRLLGSIPDPLAA